MLSSPLAPHEPGWFLLFLVILVGLVFSKPLGLWSFYSPRTVSVVVVFLLAFELWSLFFLLCFRFSVDRKAWTASHVFLVSAKLDLLRFAGDLASRPALLCSPAAYEAASSTTGGFWASTRGAWSSRAMGDLHVWEPRSFIPARLWGGFVLVGCPTAAGVVRGGACATRVGDRTVSSPGSFWAFLICVFFHYVYSCLFTVYLCNGL